MEVKVDIRKLQILNDRIAQTLDALNQVRMTVHGLGHSAYGQQPFLQQGMQGMQGMNQAFQQPFGMQHTPYQQGILGQGQGVFGTQIPFTQGLGTTPWNQQQFQQIPQQMLGGLGQQGFLHSALQNPWIAQQFQQPFGIGQTFGQQVPVDPRFLGQTGLSHTAPEYLIEQRLLEQRATDPQKLVQTFPFAFAPQTPFVGTF